MKITLLLPIVVFAITGCTNSMRYVKSLEPAKIHSEISKNLHHNLDHCLQSKLNDSLWQVENNISINNILSDIDSKQSVFSRNVTKSFQIADSCGFLQKKYTKITIITYALGGENYDELLFLILADANDYRIVRVSSVGHKVFNGIMPSTTSLLNINIFNCNTKCISKNSIGIYYAIIAEFYDNNIQTYLLHPVCNDFENVIEDIMKFTLVNETKSDGSE